MAFDVHIVSRLVQRLYIDKTCFDRNVCHHQSQLELQLWYKHLQASEVCQNSCAVESFTILDSAATKFQIKLKEAKLINWEKPVLNQE